MKKGFLILVKGVCRNMDSEANETEGGLKFKENNSMNRINYRDYFAVVESERCLLTGPNMVNIG